MNETLRCVFVANGEMQAQQVRAFLEAADIRAAERGESLRNTHAFMLDGLGAVEIMSARKTRPRARSLLDSAEAGAFRLTEDAEEPASS